MERHSRRGSMRVLAIGLCGFGLLGVLIAVAIMAGLGAEQTETSVRTRDHAEEQVESIQEQLDERGREAEEMLEQFNDRQLTPDASAAEPDEDESEEEERPQ